MKHYEANKAIRKLLELTQDDLACILGCTRQTYLSYEKGRLENAWYYKIITKVIDEYLDAQIQKCPYKWVKDECEYIKYHREEL